MKNKEIHFRLDAETHKDLLTIVTKYNENHQNKTSMSELIRMLIREYVDGVFDDEKEYLMKLEETSLKLKKERIKQLEITEDNAE